MRILLFGGTGMIGQGVLRECLLDADVTHVLSVVRAPSGTTHDKLEELVHADFFDYAPVIEKLRGYDACFFCLGVSSAGMKEADYTRVTYDLTLAAARALVAVAPGMTFIYVSGASTDSSEKGRSMWARVKGRTENAVLALPFKSAVMFRPAIIQPRYGAKSKTRLYRALYVVLWPLFPLLRLASPGFVTTTDTCGRAMLAVAKHGSPAPILENRDINRLGAP